VRVRKSTRLIKIYKFVNQLTSVKVFGLELLIGFPK
jgi:hypothetical protein